MGSMEEAVRKLRFLLILIICFIYFARGECPVGKFGAGCEFDCHCSSRTCEGITGKCFAGSRCLQEWSGPSCQRKNLALFVSSVQQSSVYSEQVAGAEKHFEAALAVDGYRDQDMKYSRGCASTKPSSFNEWSITLDKAYYIDRISIYGRTDCCSNDLDGFSAWVGDSQCYQDANDGVVSEGVINVRCTTSPVLGDKVSIRLSGRADRQLTLCEVEIYACAPGWYGPECEYICAGANCMKCNDTGNTCEDCGTGHFGEDCQFVCHCYEGEPCDRQDGKCPGKGKKLCKKGWMGDNCSTECHDYMYGPECNKPCGHCWRKNVCAKENGYCPADGNYTCEAGYSRQRCVKGCDKGYWGEDCKKKCGKCSINGSGCLPATGDCPVGLCLEGWKGRRCDEDANKECLDGMFGVDCLEECGECYGDKPCNKSTGACPSGTPFCQPGRRGSQCKAACSKGSYGNDCLGSCGNCLNNITCDVKSGLCPNQAHSSRCQPGWTGTKCLENCGRGKFGIDCKSACSGNCFSHESCDPEKGACEKVAGQQTCLLGWMGANCDKGCKFGTYGEGCMEQCGHCNLGSCNTANGSCYHAPQSPQCQEGWRGPRCDQSCVNGTYGADCLLHCHCKEGMACNKSGVCPTPEKGEHACEAGWTGQFCNFACSSNLYGEGCRQVCGHCRDTTSCDKRTGVCPLVADSKTCLDGWMGDLCNTEDSSLSGHEILYVCLTVIGVLIIAIVLGILFLIRRRRLRNKTQRRQANGHDPQQLFNLLTPEERNGSASKPGTQLKKRIIKGKMTDEYCNVSPAFTSRTIDVDQLLKFISAHRAIDGFKKEHESLPKGLTANRYEAEKSENQPKNRFQGIVAYDHSRVVLNMKEDVPCSDYINACFVHGYNEQFRYIACQGPTPAILGDFWRMVWQFDCTKIIMLTNLVEDARVKCDKYWPSEPVKEYGDIAVRSLETESLADFVIRTFSITNTKDSSCPSRLIKQFHFTVWPDHGVPTYPTALVHFREKVHTTNTTGTGPLIVHCSAGIGRTGTFIGLDYLIDQAKTEQKVDVLQCVLNMRKQRVNMIQTEEQYAFLYEALAEAVLLSKMSIPASVFEERYKALQEPNYYTETGKPGLQEQYEMLNAISPKISESDCSGACLPENVHRNRDSKILPGDNWRPFLSTPVTDCTDYINAVFMAAYRDNHAFIATQMPLPHTTVDIWRLIHSQKSQCIIMLNDLEAVEEENCVYWPYDNTTEGMFGPFKVQVISVEKKQCYDIQTMTLVYTRMPDKEPLLVKQFVVKFWKEGDNVPPNPSDLITLIEDAGRWRQQSGNAPVIVHCMNGVEKSGLYIAVSNILERLKLEQEVNILQTVKQIRINRPQVVTNIGQYQFCFEAVLAFMESFQTYSNFK